VKEDEHLSEHIRGNRLFLVALGLLILAPPAIVFFGPSIITGFPDWTWIGGSWGIALVLTLIADETLVPGRRNLSSGLTHPGHLSHRLIRNPLFISAIVVIVLAPTLIAFYLPPLFKSTPDWMWLGVAWVVALGSAWLGYQAIRREESREP
jgi:hypothetical protein